MDKQLFVQACRQGGIAIEGALRALDRAYFAQLYRECRRVIADAELAKDLVQEAFIKAWRRCSTFQGQSELLPWLRAIVRFTVIDQLRKRDAEVPLEETSLDGETFANGQLADDVVATAELQALFDRCWAEFQRTSPAHAAVLSWIVDDGLNNEQVAELLGRTPGATREYLSQCRKRARLHLAPWYRAARMTA